MRNSAEITVVTVTRNAGSLLAGTIGSVGALKRKGVHYIVVDGNSRDGTRDLLQRSAAVDLWVSEPDHGIYDAMNKALSFISGGYVLFLGAGDILLKLPTTDMLSAKADVYFGNVLLGDRLFRSTIDWRLKVRNTLHHQGLFVRRDLFGDVGFDTSYRTFADFDLNQKLYRRRVEFVPLDMTVASVETTGISSRTSHDEIVKIVRKNFGAVPAWGARALSARRERRRSKSGVAL